MREPKGGISRRQIPTSFVFAHVLLLIICQSGNLWHTAGNSLPFMADICHESTSKGLGVGHGKLTRSSVDNQYKGTTDSVNEIRKRAHLTSVVTKIIN